MAEVCPTPEILKQGAAEVVSSKHGQTKYSIIQKKFDVYKAVLVFGSCTLKAKAKERSYLFLGGAHFAP